MGLAAWYYQMVEETTGRTLMRILHFADAHIGVTTHGYINANGMNDRVLDFLSAFDHIINYIRKGDIDLVLFAGDMFHTNRPSPAYISAVTARVTQIADMCPIVIIPGNHDQATNRVSAVQYLQEIDLVNVYVSDKPIYWCVPTAQGDVHVGALPYPKLTAYGAANHQELSYTISSKLDEWLRISQSSIAPRFLLAHVAIEQADYGRYMSPVLGQDAHLLVEHVIDWDYVALGHIHKFQDISKLYPEHNYPPIIYPGSIERVDFGEEYEPRGFVVVKIDENYHLDYEFVELPARPMVTFRYVDKDIDHICADIDLHIRNNTFPIAEALVRVIIESPVNIDLTRVYTALQRVYRVASVQTRITNIATKRTDDVGNLAELSPDELIEYWLISNNVQDEDIDTMLDMFEELQHNGVE